MIYENHPPRTNQSASPVAGSSVLMLLSFLIPVQSPQKLTFCWVSVLITVLGLLNMFGRMPADAHGTASIGKSLLGARLMVTGEESAHKGDGLRSLMVGKKRNTEQCIQFSC